MNLTFYTPVEKKRKKRRLFLQAIVQLALGLLVLIIPFFTSIHVEVFIGGILLVHGALTAWNAVSGFRYGDSPWCQSLVAAISLASGMVFLFHPIAGIIIMSFFLAAYFFISGSMRIIDGFRIRSLKCWYLMLFSGAVSITLAVILWSGAKATRNALETMFAINMLSLGLCFLVISLQKKGD